jgi:hypothetical protein
LPSTSSVPPAFKRAHVFLRVALLVIIGWIAHPFGLLWLGTRLDCASLAVSYE